MGRGLGVGGNDKGVHKEVLGAARTAPHPDFDSDNTNLSTLVMSKAARGQK